MKIKKSLLNFLSVVCVITGGFALASCANEQPHTHSYAMKTILPTCTEQGYTTHTCECGHSYIDNYINPLGHEFTNYVSDDNGTCLENGTETAKCNHAGCEETDTQVLGHLYDGRSICAVCESSLKEVERIIISDSVTNIEVYAFAEYSNLIEVIIPDSVTSIEDVAFGGCSNLISVIIPDSVISIGRGVFVECGALTDITVNINNPMYKSVDGNLYTKDGKTLMQYAIGKTATSFLIPDGVTSIDDYVFAACTNLVEVVIPDSVTSIGSAVFSGCSNLRKVVIPNSVTSISEQAFNFYAGLMDLTIYCEAESQPDGWDSDWNYTTCPVVWGYKGE